MAIYHNTQSDALIRSVEFPAEAGSGYVFFHLKAGADKEAAKKQIAALDSTQQVISETQTGDQSLIVVRSGQSQEALLENFKRQGQEFVEPKVEKKFNPWKWRGITSIVGQSLQLCSGFLSTKKGSSDRSAILLFASTNLVANITNITFGSQKKDDPHQLRLLKDDFNKKYGELEQGGQVLSPDESRTALRPEAETSKTIGQKAYSVAQKYSVSGGEIGLRFFGASSLSFPITKWKRAFGKMQNGGTLKDAYLEARNDNPVTYKVGLITLLGKVISFVSKEPDPFNPKPASTLDKIREKVTFPLSSIVEGAGAAWMAHDRFFKQKIPIGGKKYPDFFGGIGNIVFIGGYAIRFFAPYGSLEVDRKELNAHITDSLAKMPREKLPQIMAETAVALNQHFKGKFSISDIYRDLAVDLSKHHQIDVGVPQGMLVAQQEQPPAKSFAATETKKMPISLQPAASHQERASLSEANPVLGV